MAPPLLLAGALAKGLPLAAGALKYLPVIGAVGGAMPGLKKGNIGEAALGAGLGALTGGTSGGLIKAGGAGAARLAGQKGLQQALKKGAQSIGAKGLAKELTGKAGQATLGKLAGDVVAPLAGAGVVFGLSQAGGDMGIPPAGGALRGAAGLAGYGSTRGENMAVGGTPLPLGMGQYGGVSPIGDPLSVVSPLGLDAGRRLRTVKDMLNRLREMSLQETWLLLVSRLILHLMQNLQKLCNRLDYKWVRLQLNRLELQSLVLISTKNGRKEVKRRQQRN